MPDIFIEHHGSIVLFYGVTDDGRAFLRERTAHDPWQWLGDQLAVEHRMAPDLVQAATAEGLTVGRP